MILGAENKTKSVDCNHGSVVLANIVERLRRDVAPGILRGASAVGRDA